MSAPSAPRDRASRRGHRPAFVLLGAALVVYVALCTVQRENLWTADAWEHHRAVAALAERPEAPGNPTYALETASIRYSPYSLALARLATGTDLDPYDVLSAAAVLNTLLLLLGLWALLRAHGEQRLALPLLIVMVLLYGGAPEFANSYALQDLPVQQVNPSAFVLALSLLGLALFTRALDTGRWPLAGVVGVGLFWIAILTHAMTALFFAAGAAAGVLARPRAIWARGLGFLAAVGLVAFSLCIPWPWFDFLTAVGGSSPDDPWTNPTLLEYPLTRWCLPAMLAALLSLPFRHRPLVRMALIGGALCVAGSLCGLLLHSSLLARLSLAGVFFFHLAVAVVVFETGLLDPRSWRARLRDACSSEPRRATAALAEGMLAFALIHFALPQLWAIVREPHLARAYVARAAGREDKQLELKQRFDTLLAPVGHQDVVLSDELTSWPIPSSRGRIVSALHYEFFVPGREARRRDVEAFFAHGSVEDAAEILERYRVRWIVLNPDHLAPGVFESLLDPGAVAREHRGWVLMDAHRWRPPEARATALSALRPGPSAVRPPDRP